MNLLINEGLKLVNNYAFGPRKSSKKISPYTIQFSYCKIIIFYFWLEERVGGGLGARRRGENKKGKEA